MGAAGAEPANAWDVFVVSRLRTPRSCVRSSAFARSTSPTALTLERLNELGSEGSQAVGVFLKERDVIAWPVVQLELPLDLNRIAGYEVRLDPEPTCSTRSWSLRTS
jgi:hypothetical protein